MAGCHLLCVGLLGAWLWSFLQVSALGIGWLRHPPKWAKEDEADLLKAEGPSLFRVCVM